MPPSPADPGPAGSLRTVSCSMTLDLTGRRTRVVAAISAAASVPLQSEALHVTVDGQGVEVTELVDAHGTRLHEFTTEGQRAQVYYSATTSGPAPTPPVDGLDLVQYLRPSRYVESDSLAAVASTEFGGLSGFELVSAVDSWVHEKLTYAAGSSRPTDGAVQTVLNRRGVCRDYAHVTSAFLRAMNVPARVVAVYAPGLSPMEFHAVTEAFVEGTWYVVDPTRLAPRQSMLRVATGRDAADVAFLTNHWGLLELSGYQVTAVADQLPTDDPSQHVVLS
ncbi:transglutaminase-like domain-containing protein [Auraticoccus monumenti]|uniref:Transglutaminase-like superfamily protein n=1 Tax=Auraticoccus monumenti TaxID=675864 RepID=A0A1G6ZLV4_9ACTN|nr:transglutaminase family protein [Auraticoccus monumenti]SDE03490.1 Transglutaminase-like superfamily protein [Auraticoccus monumenti]